MQTVDPARHEHAITPAEWRIFSARLLHAGGLGSLGAGIVFFVAANWQAWGLAGRFGLLEGGLAICVAAALWQPQRSRVGQGALLLATLFVGALLALFGQNYQTGADVYELFLAWALLALPFALAAMSGAVWATWWVVLDVALGLLCCQAPSHRLGALLFDGGGQYRVTWLMLACLANLSGAGVFVQLARTRFATAAPAWLARFLLAVSLACGTIAALPRMSDHPTAVIALYAVIAAGIGIATWARRDDVFPLTVLSASLIVTSTAWLCQMMGSSDFGILFILAIWLIASSTAAAMLLMHRLRQWRTTVGDGVTA